MSEPDAKGTSRTVGRRAASAFAVFALVCGTVILFPPDNPYLWIKAFHIIAVISWMAGLLYLPRLFIYHSDHPAGTDGSEQFKLMEMRLYRFIMNPAMMIAWLLGLWLAWTYHHFQGGWLHAKLLLVVMLTATHVYFGRAVRQFAADGPRRTTRHWRLWNEAPTVLMIVIVILVVVQPF